MRLNLIFMILIILLVPLAIATEITGDLSTNPAFFQEGNNPEPTPPTPPSTSTGGESPGYGRNTENTTSVTTTTPPTVQETPLVAPKETITPTQTEKTTVPTPRGQVTGQIWESTVGATGLMKFTINQEPHSLTVNQVNENGIEFTLRSDPITDTIQLNQVKQYDLNGDGENDVFVYLRDISDGKAWLRVKDITPTVPNNDITGAVVGAPSGKINYGIILSGITLIIVALAVGSFYFNRKPAKKKRTKH